MSIQWHNNRTSISKDEKSFSLFEKYNISEYEDTRSMGVYIQEECLPFEEVIPTDYLLD